MICIPVRDFNLEATLTSGQVFGFKELSGSRFEGRFNGFKALLCQKGDVLEVSSREDCRDETVSEQFRSFFDLDRDLSGIFRVLQSEEHLQATHHRYRGLRLIRQDEWEAIACFIISSNNNVKRIQLIWQNLSAHFNPTAQNFPKPAQIARSNENTLRKLGLGYRAAYLYQTACMVARDPAILQAIRCLPYEKAKERLMEFPGVGPKVADCALLYGFHQLEAFPVDIWMLRAMRFLYFRGRKVNEQKVQDFARRRWQGMSGYIQQYIFHSARMGLWPL